MNSDHVRLEPNKVKYSNGRLLETLVVVLAWSLLVSCSVRHRETGPKFPGHSYSLVSAFFRLVSKLNTKE